MPIYLDEDYNYKPNKELLERHQATMRAKNFAEISLTSSDEDEAAKELAPIDLNLEATLDQAINLYEQVTTRQASYFLSVYARNSKCVELKRYINEIVAKPKMLYACQIKGNERFKKISKCFQMIRDFPNVDESTISTTGLQSFATLSIYDQIHFQRSFEDVRNFECSSNPQRMYLACAIYRSLHVYDFIRSEQLFSVPLANIINPTANT